MASQSLCTPQNGYTSAVEEIGQCPVAPAVAQPQGNGAAAAAIPRAKPASKVPTPDLTAALDAQMEDCMNGGYVFDAKTGICSDPKVLRAQAASQPTMSMGSPMVPPAYRGPSISADRSRPSPRQDTLYETERNDTTLKVGEVKVGGPKGKDGYYGVEASAAAAKMEAEGKGWKADVGGGTTSARLAVGPNGFRAGLQANACETSATLGTEGTPDHDMKVRGGVSLGAGLDARMSWGDTDGDGRNEYCIGADVLWFSGDVCVEGSRAGVEPPPRPTRKRGAPHTMCSTVPLEEPTFAPPASPIGSPLPARIGSPLQARRGGINPGAPLTPEQVAATVEWLKTAK